MTSRLENITRTKVQALDEILGIPFKVLDDGFIRVVDYMGSDGSVVQAARVSYGQGTKQLNEDRGLIRYLMRHQHTTPFEMCELKMHIRVPMDCWRQWIRHRTASVNEYSTRYSIAIDAMQKTDPSEWRLQSTSNKQGSGDFLDLESGTKLSAREREIQVELQKVYHERLNSNVAREQARKDLPLSTYTEAYWKIDLHNLLNFLALRMDSHAQFEIRSYANIIGNEIVQRWCPITWGAFKSYRLNSINLSEIEISIVRLCIEGKLSEAKALLIEKGLLSMHNNEVRISRELKEIENTLKRLGINSNWF